MDKITETIKNFDDLFLENNCKLVYIGRGLCHNCCQKRHKLKKTLFLCKECQYGLCLTCFEEHKILQIMKKLKEINISSFEKLLKLMIVEENLKIAEVSQRKNPINIKNLNNENYKTDKNIKNEKNENDDEIDDINETKGVKIKKKEKKK